MAKSKIHVTGKTECTITMYETVLKTIKEQFGQPSVIARAYITKLTDKRKIQDNDRQALQELFFDVVNCVAALKQIVHLADENATDNLCKAVRRMPPSQRCCIERKGITRPLNILPSSFEIVSKPNLIWSFETFPAEKWHFRRSKEQRQPFECYMRFENHPIVNCPTFSSCPIDAESCLQETTIRGFLF